MIQYFLVVFDKMNVLVDVEDYLFISFIQVLTRSMTWFSGTWSIKTSIRDTDLRAKYINYCLINLFDRSLCQLV